ncbi:tol-pal system-associated acyl-CoA thioesterase [Alphaproteobacteria bacterium]|nr:tol-pal system-associated acyl-CoA thioesterase [Alphaproteobacteria bacterium]
MISHTIPIRIYYEDTDAGGVVYHARYINFAERARAEMLRDMGFQSSDIAKQLGMHFVVANLEINYMKPAFLDDLLSLKTSVLEIKNSSFILKHEFFRGDESIANINVTLVCVSVDGIKPVRMPEELRKAFQDA